MSAVCRFCWKTPHFSAGQNHLRFNLSIEPNTRMGS